MWFLAIACCLAAVSSAPVVQTRLGSITGIVFESSPHRDELFLGIPYAKPPVGDLRFELPEPFVEVGNRSATKIGDYCIGRIEAPFMSEDCLYLNVFRRENTRPDDGKPVLVFFLGGYYSVISGILFNPASLVSFGDVIAVTVNYRIGMLGFANFGDLAPGNVGFFDQRLALEWVKDNIGAFGGNPDDVTIGGSGESSASVHAQIVTPLNRGKRLFNAAFMDAGFLGLGLKEETEESLDRLRKIALKVNCPTQNRIMVRCLKNLSVSQMNNAQKMFNISDRLTIFRPTIDGVFIPKHVDEMDANEFANVKLMVGVSEEDGSLFVNNGDSVLNIPNTEEDFLRYCAKMGKLFSFQANFSDPGTRQRIIAAYYNQYPTQFERVARFLTDSSFLCPAKKFVENYVRHNQNVYMFHFERRFQMSSSKFALAFHGSPSICFMGYHLSQRIDEKERSFVEDAIKMFSGFVKTNHVPELRGTQWPDFADAGQVLRIDENPIIADSLPYKQNCDEIFS